MGFLPGCAGLQLKAAASRIAPRKRHSIVRREFVRKKKRPLRSDKSELALPLSARNKLSMAQTAQERIEEIARFKIRVSPSRIHRLGVFAAQNIPARARVIEYQGKRLTRRQACEVFRERLAGNSPHLHYLARLDSYWTLDGAIGGSGAEFVNHSCDANVEMKAIRKHIWVIALRNIRRGEELLCDYAYDPNGLQIKCHCGSPKCRGTLNRATPESKRKMKVRTRAGD